MVFDAIVDTTTYGKRPVKHEKKSISWCFCVACINAKRHYWKALRYWSFWPRQFTESQISDQISGIRQWIHSVVLNWSFCGWTTTGQVSSDFRFQFQNELEQWIRDGCVTGSLLITNIPPCLALTMAMTGECSSGGDGVKMCQNNTTTATDCDFHPLYTRNKPYEGSLSQ